MAIKILQISPYEPPASGWVSRIKLLRRVIEARGGRCEILDIGPNRTWERPGCIPVYGGMDYLRKVRDHAAQGFGVHTHINGEYFRGMLLALAATMIFRFYRRRSVVTVHAGTDQKYFAGWYRWVTGPVYRLIFALSDAVVCNSEPVKQRLLTWARGEKIHPIGAFSKQYLEFQHTDLESAAEAFFQSHEPIVSTYLCFRDGFFVETVLDALPRLIDEFPHFGLMIVGTGDGEADFVAEIERRGLANNVCLLGDLDHDRFLSLIHRSAVHLRTPVTDGVSSTVLEAMHVGTPVVASDNGTRPSGVVRYLGDDSAAMATAICATLKDREAIAAAMTPPPVADTAAIEVNLLSGT